MKRGLLLDTASRSLPPPGKRPPRPGMLRQGLRLLWLLSSVLSLALVLLQAADEQHALRPFTVGDYLLRASDPLLAAELHRPLYMLALWLTLVVAGEYILQLGVRRVHRRTILRRTAGLADRLVFQVRAPRNTPLPAMRQQHQPSADLFRAISAAIPCHGQRVGRAPYVSFTLLGEPDQATTLQYVVAGGTAQQRMHLADVLRTTVMGQRPQALVEQVADPLHAALTSSAARAVVWRTFRLALPPHYPLRFADDTEQTDLLGPVLFAVQTGAGVHLTELAITLQPIGGVLASFLHRGWRGQATALRLRLEQHEEYALHDDGVALEQKLAGPPFYVTLRVVAVATEHAAAQRQVAAVADALAAYQSRTSHLVQGWVSGAQRDLVLAPPTALAHTVNRHLALLLARAPQPIPAPALVLPSFLLRTPAIVSSGELAALWHLPTPLLQDLIRHLPSRSLPAPPPAFVGAHDQDRFVVGHAQRGDGSWQPVGPTRHDLREILHVIAGQGAGKTRLVVNLVAQCFASGCTLMNGKGDDVGGATATVQQLLSPADEARLVLWNPLDAQWPISFNPLATADLTQPGMEDLVLGQVQSVFQRIDAEGMRNGPVMQMLLDMATLLVLGGGGQPTLAHIEHALLDAPYRANLLPQIVNPKVRSYWEARRDGYSEREQQSVEALQRRFHKLLTSELVRSLLVEPQPLFDWGRAIDERWIVLVDLPHNRLGGLAGVLGMLLFGAFIRAALQRTGDAQQRVNYPLFIDEVQVFLEHTDGSDFALALSQLRGFGIPTAYFHQALAQLGPYQDLMQVNAGSRIIMRTKYPDSAALAREYAAWGLTDTDISGLDPTQQQYAVLRVHGQQCGPFSLRPLPWPVPPRAVARGMATLHAWHQHLTHPHIVGPADPSAWQQHVPPDSPCPEVDREIVRLVYGTHAAPAVITRFADPRALSDDDWTAVLTRWDAIRRWQRQELLAHPMAIPDRRMRQQWLSRLLVAHPRILTRIAYTRAWQTIMPAPHPPRTAPIARPVLRARDVVPSTAPPRPTPGRAPTFAAIDQPAQLPYTLHGGDDDAA